MSHVLELAIEVIGALLEGLADRVDDVFVDRDGPGVGGSDEGEGEEFHFNYNQNCLHQQINQTKSLLVIINY